MGTMYGHMGHIHQISHTFQKFGHTIIFEQLINPINIIIM